MSGGESWEDRGIIPRTFEMLFGEINKARQKQRHLQYNLYVSYFEIYNECGYDLLDKKHAEITFDKWSKIHLYEDLQ